MASLLGLVRRLVRRAAAPPPAPVPSPCASCPLAHCAAGVEATVICISCPAHDAARLRSLGLYEGARVGVVDTRSGVLLDVRGARLALGAKVVAAITVLPLCR
jgi:Fe2+ transport system protein FeoA